jgi:hypothetical protein
MSAISATPRSLAYPQNLLYLVRRFKQTRNTKWISPQNLAVATAGQQITVTLPSNILCDLDSFRIYFNASTTVTNSTTDTPYYAQLPLDVDGSLFERVEVTINGTLVSSINGYNQLWRTVCDSQINGVDGRNRRSCLQKAGTLVSPVASNEAAGAFYCIANFLGFLGTASPRILNTSVVGNVQVRLTLASNQILALSNAAAIASYSLSNIYATCSCLTVDDGMYQEGMNVALAQGKGYEIYYQDYTHFLSSMTNNWTSSSIFSVSTQSLDRIIAFFTNGGADSTLDPVLLNSNYFTHIGGNSADTTIGGVSTFNFGYAGVEYPNYRVNTKEAFQLLSDMWSHTHSTTGGFNPILISQAPGTAPIDTWRNKMFTAVVQLCHTDNDGGENWISGLDTRGQAAQGYFSTTGVVPSNANFSALAHIYCQTSEVYRFGAGLQGVAIK